MSTIASRPHIAQCAIFTRVDYKAVPERCQLTEKFERSRRAVIFVALHNEKRISFGRGNRRVPSCLANRAVIMIELGHFDTESAPRDLLEDRRLNGSQGQKPGIWLVGHVLFPLNNTRSGHKSRACNHSLCESSREIGRHAPRQRTRAQIKLLDAINQTGFFFSLITPFYSHFICKWPDYSGQNNPPVDSLHYPRSKWQCTYSSARVIGFWVYCSEM